MNWSAQTQHLIPPATWIPQPPLEVYREMESKMGETETTKRIKDTMGQVETLLLNGEIKTATDLFGALVEYLISCEVVKDIEK